jgi:hypothetical protein
MSACDRAGNFRAEIVEYGLKATDKDDSKSVAVSFRVLLTEWWDGEKWVPWSEYEMEAHGDAWIVKKDGKLNQRAINDLCKNCGWDGVLSSIANMTWKPTPFQVETKPHVYKEEKTYRIEWINPFDAIPGAAGVLGNVDDSKLKQLEQQFGPQLRALAGNVSRNSTTAAGRPVPPPPPPKPAVSGELQTADGIKY